MSALSQTLLLWACTLRHARMVDPVWRSQQPRAGARPCKPWLFAYTSNHAMLVAGRSQNPWTAQLLVVRLCPSSGPLPLASCKTGTLHHQLQPSWGSYCSSAAHQGTAPMQPMGSARNRALRRHKVHAQAPAKCSRLPQACSAGLRPWKGSGDKLNPKLLCLATSGPRPDERHTWHLPMRQSAWR